MPARLIRARGGPCHGSRARTASEPARFRGRWTTGSGHAGTGRRTGPPAGVGVTDGGAAASSTRRGRDVGVAGGNGTVLAAVRRLQAARCRATSDMSHAIGEPGPVTSRGEPRWQPVDRHSHALRQRETHPPVHHGARGRAVVRRLRCRHRLGPRRDRRRGRTDRGAARRWARPGTGGAASAPGRGVGPGGTDGPARAAARRLDEGAPRGRRRLQGAGEGSRGAEPGAAIAAAIGRSSGARRPGGGLRDGTDGRAGTGSVTASSSQLRRHGSGPLAPRTRRPRRPSHSRTASKTGVQVRVPVEGRPGRWASRRREPGLAGQTRPVVRTARGAPSQSFAASSSSGVGRRGLVGVALGPLHDVRAQRGDDDPSRAAMPYSSRAREPAMPFPSWAGSTMVCTGTSARAGASRTKYSMWPTTSSPGQRLQAARRPVVADLDVAHGHAPGPSSAEADSVRTGTACGLRSWSEPGTGSDGSAPRATMRLSRSTCTTRGSSARASASVT